MLVFAAAWLFVAKAYGERSSEAIVAAGLYSIGLIVLPLLALGWCGLLSVVSLAGLELVLIALTVIVPWGSLSLRYAAARACAVDVLRLPTRLFAAGGWLRGASGVFLIPALLICAWTLFLSYLAPPSGWDGLWYHDPIVGFAIGVYWFVARGGGKLIEASGAALRVCSGIACLPASDRDDRGLSFLVVGAS